jgi:hypothetical protein
MENDNYIQQKDEIDLLNNIIPDKMKILNENPFELEISIEADVEKPLYSFKLLITLNNEYPNEIPSFKLSEENNLIASKKVEEIEEKLKELCNEQLGMPIIYQLYEFVLTHAQNLEENNEKEENEKLIKLEEEKKLFEEKKRKEEEDLLEKKTYTPVTKELFNEWYAKFIEKKNKEKNNIQNKKNLGKLTGKEIFLNKNLKIDENEIEKQIEENNKINVNKITNKNEEEEEQEEEDEKIEINKENEELFQDDIDDLNFDKENEEEEEK